MEPDFLGRELKTDNPAAKYLTPLQFHHGKSTDPAEPKGCHLQMVNTKEFPSQTWEGLGVCSRYGMFKSSQRNRTD